MSRSSALYCALAALLILSVPLPAAQAAPAHAATAAPRCFSESSYCVDGTFRSYWEQNGGLSVFGLPVTATRDEHSRDTGSVYQTQWLERNRFELHPENRAPYTVLLGRLGDDALRQAGRDWTSLPKASPSAPHYFPQTGHAVTHEPFWRYWRTHGLELGDRGVSERESLALFGYPLTEATVETNSSGDTVLTQWFERARFEYHPTNPEPYKVLLGLLGNEVLGPSGRQPLPGRIAFVRQGDLYVSNGDGSQPRRLTEHGIVGTPSWSPDGQRIAFWGPGGLNIISAAGNQPARVVFAGSSIGPIAASWSPDGQRLVVDSLHDLHVVKADGSGAINITNSSGQEWAARWSPDGQRIVFMFDNEFSIWTINPDGSGRTRVNPRTTDASPHWSPDGRRLAFISIRNGLNYDIYLANPDGSAETNLTNMQGEEVNLSWSPDGQRIAFVYHNNGQINIHTTTLDGTRSTALAELESQDSMRDPEWSPDSRWLLFIRGGNLYAVGAEGGPQIRLTGTGDIADPVWSPN